ncbi:LPXTG cell wall anchor domain-containing protein [Enterococcus faecalis]|nr:LPXTG cell wall anchor domain-containing protein [Enterococcus faecalis]EHZ9213586.1 LPXTG cell wall anchor domain-containing protein [Enterococcus faecalis]
MFDLYFKLSIKEKLGKKHSNENPVNTDTGVVIVAVEAKEIGADVQKDGTVTVKGSDGRMKVLPKTGETENIALSVLGSLMVLGSAFIFKKRI